MIDFIIAIIFISLNLMMFLNNYNLLEYYYGKNLSNIDKIIISLLLYFAKIYFILFMLGSIGLLNLKFVLTSVIIIEALNSVIYFKTRSFILPELNFNISFVLKKPLLLFALAFVSSPFLYAIVKGSLFSSLDYDSLWYHLPAVINWLKTESLLSTQTPFGYYPLSGGLLSLWLMIPFNNDVLANYQNILPTILCLFVVYEINKFYFSLEWNLLIIVSLFSVFTLPYQLFAQLNDVLVLTFFCTVLYGFLRYQQNPRVIYIIVSGIALGVLIGLKYSMIAYSILIFTPLFLKGNNVKISKKLNNIFILLILSIVFGCFWYVRNWILLKSAIYPLPLTIGDLKIFSPIIDNNLMDYFNPKTSTLIVHICELKLWYYIFLNITKGGITYLLLIPLLIFSLFRINKLDFPNRYILFFLFFYSVLLAFLAPNSAENDTGTLNLIKGYHTFRYGLISLYLVLLIGFSLLLKVKKSNQRQYIKTIIIISSIIAVLFSLPPFVKKYNGLLVFLLTSINLIIIILFTSIRIRRISIKKIMFCVIILSVLIPIEKYYKELNRSELYNNYLNIPISRYYNKSTKLLIWYYNNVHNKNVTLYGLKSYPFYGSEFENNIIFETGKNSLEHIDFVIVARDYPVPYSDKFGVLPSIDEVIKRNPNFKLVYEDDLANVYKNLSIVE